MISLGAALPSPSPSPSPAIPFPKTPLFTTQGLVLWGVLLGVGFVLYVLYVLFAGRRRGRPPAHLPAPVPGWATIKELQLAGMFAPDPAAAPGGRLYVAEQIGVWQEGRKIREKRASLFLPAGQSALVVGPTGSGKTSAIIKPAVVCWGAGSAVVTSTKPDVLRTWANRAQYGPVSLYDPTASVGRPDLTVGWTPLWRCQTWDHAVETAAALLAPHARDATAKNAGHFAAMGRQLLAPLLHAAALSGAPMAGVRTWVLGGAFEVPLAALARANAETARTELLAIAGLPDGEHAGSIRATAATALAWAVRDSIRASTDPALTTQLDIDRLLTERGTLYVVSPSRTMTELAPLTSALIDAIAGRALELAVQRGGRLSPPLLLALDEAAHVSPIDSLPALLAEGGQQGVTCLVALQDISQAYARWGRDAAHTLWNNAGARLVLPGLADPPSLELVSKQTGEVERWYQSVSDSQGSSSGHHSGGSSSGHNRQRSDSWSTRWEPLLRAADVGRMDPGTAILLARSLKPAWLMLSPMYLDDPGHNLPPPAPDPAIRTIGPSG